MTLENLSISHTANGAPNITGSTHALYTLILRNVSFVENVYIVDNLFNQNVEMVNLSHAQRVTFIDCDLSTNMYASLGTSNLVSLDASQNVSFIGCDFSRNSHNNSLGTSNLVSLDTSQNVNFIDCDFSRNKFIGHTVGAGF